MSILRAESFGSPFLSEPGGRSLDEDSNELTAELFLLEDVWAVIKSKMHHSAKSRQPCVKYYRDLRFANA